MALAQQCRSFILHLPSIQWSDAGLRYSSRIPWAITSAGDSSTFNIPALDQKSIACRYRRVDRTWLLRGAEYSESLPRRRAGCPQRLGYRGGILEPTAYIPRHDFVGFVRMRSGVLHSRGPGAAHRLELFLAAAEYVRLSQQAVGEQSGLLRAVGQQVTVLGFLPA